MSRGWYGWLLPVVVPLFLAGCATTTSHGTHGAVEQPLIEAAQTVGADELILIQDGNTIVEWSAGRYGSPHQLMSITKSVVALALGALMDDGRLGANDTLDKFYPTLRGDPRGKVTVDQILTMTSGLGTTYPDGDVETDCLDEALRQPLLHSPGTNISYNNDAVNLLSGVVEGTTGTTLKDYVDRVLLAPLGITDWSWFGDANGHTWVMTGLALQPTDLAKIGQLVLNRGVWHGKQLISSEWVDGLFRPTPLFRGYGRLWLMGTEGFSAPSERLRARGEVLVYASGDCNQVLVLDRQFQSILVVQTERLARPDSELNFADLEPVIEAFVRVLP